MVICGSIFNTLLEYLDDPANEEKLKEKKKSLHIYNYLGKADKYIEYEKAQGFFSKVRDVNGF
jgi:hypothetical protein